MTVQLELAKSRNCHSVGRRRTAAVRGASDVAANWSLAKTVAERRIAESLPFKGNGCRGGVGEEVPEAEDYTKWCLNCSMHRDEWKNGAFQRRTSNGKLRRQRVRGGSLRMPGRHFLACPQQCNVACWVKYSSPEDRGLTVHNTYGHRILLKKVRIYDRTDNQDRAEQLWFCMSFRDCRVAKQVYDSLGSRLLSCPRSRMTIVNRRARSGKGGADFEDK